MSDHHEHKTRCVFTPAMLQMMRRISNSKRNFLRKSLLRDVANVVQPDSAVIVKMHRAIAQQDQFTVGRLLTEGYAITPECMYEAKALAIHNGNDAIFAQMYANILVYGPAGQHPIVVQFVDDWHRHYGSDDVLSVALLAAVRNIADDANGTQNLVDRTTHKQLEHIRDLITFGVDIDSVNIDMSEGVTGTALMAAAAEGNHKAVCWLLYLGANHTIKNERGLTAWHYAACSGNDTVMQLLSPSSSMLSPIFEHTVGVSDAYDD